MGNIGEKVQDQPSLGFEDVELGVVSGTRLRARVAYIVKWLKRLLSPPEGLTLDCVGPVSREFGFDRGTPVDRHYIQSFLGDHRHLITGKVLEIAESTYTDMFGQAVTSSDILHVESDSPKATLVGDLSKSDTIPTNQFDCFICTQTFNFIYSFHDAIRGAFQVLRPGGTLLATVASMSQMSPYDEERWGDYWRFTPQAAARIFGEVFGAQNISVVSYGNCYACVNFLRGVACEELISAHLDVVDKAYPLIVGIVAKKPQNTHDS